MLFACSQDKEYKELVCGFKEFNIEKGRAIKYIFDKKIPFHPKRIPSWKIQFTTLNAFLENNGEAKYLIVDRTIIQDPDFRQLQKSLDYAFETQEAIIYQIDHHKHQSHTLDINFSSPGTSATIYKNGLIKTLANDQRVLDIGPDELYPFTFKSSLSELGISRNEQLKIAIDYRSPNPHKGLLFVYSILSEKDEQLITFDQQLIAAQDSSMWNTQEYLFKIPNSATSGDRFKIYLWNASNTSMQIDRIFIGKQQLAPITADLLGEVCWRSSCDYHFLNSSDWLNWQNGISFDKRIKQQYKVLSSHERYAINHTSTLKQMQFTGSNELVLEINYKNITPKDSVLASVIFQDNKGVTKARREFLLPSTKASAKTWCQFLKNISLPEGIDDDTDRVLFRVINKNNTEAHIGRVHLATIRKNNCN